MHDFPTRRDKFDIFGVMVSDWAISLGVFFSHTTNYQLPILYRHPLPLEALFIGAVTIRQNQPGDHFMLGRNFEYDSGSEVNGLFPINSFKLTCHRQSVDDHWKLSNLRVPCLGLTANSLILTLLSLFQRWLLHFSSWSWKSHKPFLSSMCRRHPWKKSCFQIRVKFYLLSTTFVRIRYYSYFVNCLIPRIYRLCKGIRQIILKNLIVKKSRTEKAAQINWAIFEKRENAAKIQNSPVGVIWQEEAKEKNRQAGDRDEAHWIWI